MNKLKKLASLLLALVMALALAAPAFASNDEYADNATPELDKNSADQVDPSDTPDGSYPSTTTNCSITVENATENHNYNAYQIFAGDLNVETVNGETLKTLSNISWGNGVTADGQAYFGDAADKADTLSSASDAEAFAKELVNYLGVAKPMQYANGTYKADGLAPGYYLIVDEFKTGSDVDGKNDALSAYIMQVLGTETMKPKAQTPSLDKKITGLDNVTAQKLEAISAEVGKTVNFELTSTVPEITGYTNKYTYTVHDTMSSGLTFNDDVEVTIDGVKFTDVTVANDNGNITITADAEKLLAYIKNTPVAAGKEIKVTYSADVNKNALTTNVETNSAKLEFSNNPYEESSTGETPESTVYVYDFTIEIEKVDADDDTKKLSGAEFVLTSADGTKYYKQDDTTKEVTWVDNEDDATKLTTNDEGMAEPGFQGIAAGTYQLKETKAPAGYNLLSDPIEVKIVENRDSEGNVTDYTISFNGVEAANGKFEVSANKTSTPDAQLTVTDKIANSTGALLPETGGIGTTIFYIVGGVLAAGAVILLITKRRMNIDKQ